MKNREGWLILEDGLAFKGRSIGSFGEVCGEMVFNTSMTGYQEILTDPSYYDQILTMTYPLIGNYGINPYQMQSNRIQVKGFLVKNCSPYYSHRQATQSLSEFLITQGTVALEGLDTRKLTRHLSNHGSMKGILSTQTSDKTNLLTKLRNYPNMKGKSLVHYVTTSKRYSLSATKKKQWTVDLLDCGVKKNIIKILTDHGCDVNVFPANTPANILLKTNSDGVLISNGPGDPEPLVKIIETIRMLLGKKPLVGICLGHQLIALALGAKTYKLKFGHRGANHPIQESSNGSVKITSQNHGFCVSSEKTIDQDIIWNSWNLNDNTVAGLSHKKYPILSVQYHPEATPGPRENIIFFQKFMNMMTRHQNNIKKLMY